MNRVPYRTSLRVLGRLLNGDKARMVTVCEVDDGFLLHYFMQGDPCRVNTRAIHSAEVLDLDDLLHGQRGKPEPDGSFKGLQTVLGFRQGEALKFQKSHPLCPMGYENVLRALGETLDRRHAQAILIHELEDNVHVEYTIDRADFVLRDGVRMAIPGRREEHYKASGIEGLVRACREQTAEKVRRNGQNLSYNPLDVATYLDTAQTLEDDGHHRDAEDLFRKAAQLAPAHPEAHYGLARLARRRGDRKAALKFLQSATTLDPANGRYLHLLGRINMERAQLDDAVAALRQAVALEPGNRMYLFDLSRAYERLGRPEEASAVLARYGAGVSARAAWGGGDRAGAAPPAATPPVERGASVSGRVARLADPADDAHDVPAPQPRQDEASRRGPVPEDPSESRLPAGGASFPPRDGQPRRIEQHRRAEDGRAASVATGDLPDVALAAFAPRLKGPMPTLPRVTRLTEGQAADAGAGGGDTDTGGGAERGSVSPAKPSWGATERSTLPDTSTPLPPAATPFSGDAPPWEDTTARRTRGQGSTESEGGGTAGAAASRDGRELPMLRLALTNDWSVRALPSIHIPTDATDATDAASLPLAVAHHIDGRQPAAGNGFAPADRGGTAGAGDVSASRRVTPGPSDEESGLLATATMRAEESVRAEPHRADLHRKLGFLLAKQGRSEDAAAEFRRAVECGRRRFTE